MTYGPGLLVGTVAAVGVLHTMVPDHWVPITLIARQRGWSRRETARASLQAGTGHVLSTLVIALVVWLAGVTLAQRFDRFIDAASSVALITFGVWLAVSAWRDLGRHQGHGHSHTHDFAHLHGQAQRAGQLSVHGPELERVPTEEGVIELSIFEVDVPPRFRLSGVNADALRIETRRDDGGRQVFACTNHGPYWESIEAIPEPHQFDVAIVVEHGGHSHVYQARFTEHHHDHGEHGHDHASGTHSVEADDPLYAPLRGETVAASHAHRHRHEGGSVHAHWHDHTLATSHEISADVHSAPALHDHRHKTTARTALLLILGSSPMVEGIPAFFAASKYGVGLIVVMAIVFGLSTIATYVGLCVLSTAGLQRVSLGAFERYGEVLSGGFIALVGVAFWIWPAF